MGRIQITLTILALALLGGGVAHADSEEWRFGLSAGADYSNVSLQGVSSASFVPGARLRAAYGLSDQLDVGGNLGFQQFSNFEFDGAQVQGKNGNLFANLFTFEMSADVRYTADNTISPLFAETRPFAGARAGLMYRGLSARSLASPAGFQLMSLGDDSSVLPLIGGTLGVERRVNTYLALGLAADVTLAGTSYQAIGFSIEASWLTY
jgi:hypothetical protein